MGAATSADMGAAVEHALDGRTVMWLHDRTGIAYHNLRRGIQGRRRFSAGELAAIRAALPSLPPPPEPTNGHTKEGAYAAPLDGGTEPTTSTNG
jgi:hypothetical protein